MTVRDDLASLEGQLRGVANFKGFLITRWERVDEVADVGRWLVAWKPVALALRAIDVLAERWLGRSKVRPDVQRALLTIRDAAKIGLAIGGTLALATPAGVITAGVSAGLDLEAMMSRSRREKLRRDMDAFWRKADEAARSAAQVRASLDREVKTLRV